MLFILSLYLGFLIQFPLLHLVCFSEEILVILKGGVVRGSTVRGENCREIARLRQIMLWGLHGVLQLGSSTIRPEIIRFSYLIFIELLSSGTNFDFASHVLFPVRHGYRL